MKQLVGSVVSDKMEKTVVVMVKTMWRHPLYKKTVSRTKKYLVHDNLGAKVGDQVSFVESKPISKRVKFVIKEIVNNSTDGKK
jgi:small subunit ribosomal protein S17